MKLSEFNPLTWNPKRWASLVPFGIGQQRPNNYLEVFLAAWESKDNLGYAWKVLNDGVCDGCALGTSGLKDWTLDGIHLCNIRLRLLRLNTMPALEPAWLSDVSALRALSSAQLRDLGRLPYPMRRRRFEAGFTRVSWEDALSAIAQKISHSSANNMGFFLTSRGMTNEGYYAVQKAVRAFGSNSIDNAARLCHSPSTVALKETLGIAATTCSYSDWIGSDVVVFIGSNVATNQPVATKYLHHAKVAGTKVICVNAYREPGMERYWVPSAPESAVFGTKITDDFYLVNTGGDAAFLSGVLKHLLELGLENREFIAAHTSGFEALQTHLEQQDWAELERFSGSSRTEMQALAQTLGHAKTGVLVWSMGVTQHFCGENTVRAIVNLGLALGWVGRDHCGLMPIRGHSGVQAGAEMGAYSTMLPGGAAPTEENYAALEKQYGFALSRQGGLTVPEMIDAASQNKFELLFAVGGNFLEVLPDPEYVAQALQNVPLRVHMDLVLSSQMLLDGEDVIVLPATTRYEIAGGVTETSTERRVIFSPEITGHRIPEARAEWEVFNELARRINPKYTIFTSTPEIRAEIAKVVPMYAGIEHLAHKGDQFQIAGRHLCAGGVFKTPDSRGKFSVVVPADSTIPEGFFRLSTRRGKQFNSMVHEQKDSINGATRDAVLMNPADAAKLGVQHGGAVRLTSSAGSLLARVCVANVKPGNVQVHFPEGNVLLDKNKRSDQSHIPDYNALVEITLLTSSSTAI
jgi:molybdopterin-dependent oxidoreductase alpha subunit